MKEKNLIDFKDEYAIENGHGSWYDMRNANEVTISDCEEVALRYANHVKAIALQEGRNEGFAKGCELQKKVCAKYPLVCSETKEPASNQYVKNEYGGNEIFFVDKDSILNAPDAVNPYTK